MAFVPIALSLLPYVPGLIDSARAIVNAVRADPMTPAEYKAKADALAARLDALALEIEAVVIRKVS